MEVMATLKAVPSRWEITWEEFYGSSNDICSTLLNTFDSIMSRSSQVTLDSRSPSTTSDPRSSTDSSEQFPILRIVEPGDSLQRETENISSAGQSSTPTSLADSGDSGIGSQSDLSFVDRVVMEIIDSETVYVSDLQQVIQGYIDYWRNPGAVSPLTPEQSACLFGNLESVYQFNSRFLERLLYCRADPVRIARCFVQNNAGFAIYTDYCTNYPKSVSVLTELLRNAKSAQVFRTRQKELQHTLPLGSYLLKPVQRILKYHLLLRNLAKNYDGSSSGYTDVIVALSAMTGIAHHINDMKRKHEHSVRVQEIQSLLYGWQGADLTTFGELVAEGSFRMYGARNCRHVFLFDTLLLICKRRDDGTLHYKSHITCSNLMLVESVPGDPLSFHVIPFDNPRSQYTLQARNREQKREWTFQLKRVILEHYNAEIPAHARQLVLQLGQESCQKNQGPEHCCSRKHYSAPEYLERRRNSSTAETRHKTTNFKDSNPGSSVPGSPLSFPKFPEHVKPGTSSPGRGISFLIRGKRTVNRSSSFPVRKKSASLPRSFQESILDKSTLPERPFTIAADCPASISIDYSDIDQSSIDCSSVTPRISQDNICVHPEHRIYRRSGSRSSLKNVISSVSIKLWNMKSIDKESILPEAWRKKLKIKAKKSLETPRIAVRDPEEEGASIDTSSASIDTPWFSDSDSLSESEEDFYERSFEIIEQLRDPDWSYRDSFLLVDYD